MGYNQHNAGLHFVRFRQREDLSYYDRLVARQREKERFDKLLEALERMEREEEKARQEQERKAMEEQIRRDEARGIFTPEKLKEVNTLRKSYFTPPEIPENSENRIHHSESPMGRCGKKPGQKQILDASVTDHYPFTILVNMLLIAWKKKKDLYYITEAINAIMYDNQLLHSEYFKMQSEPFGKTMVILSLLSEILECDIRDLFYDDNEVEIQEFVYSAMDTLKNKYCDVDGNDDWSWVTIEFTHFDYLLGMTKYFNGFGSPPTLIVERWALVGGGYLYTVSYRLSSRYISGSAFGQTVEFYEEENGKLQEITDRLIEEEKKWREEHPDQD